MKKTLLSLAIASLAAGQSVCAAVEKVYNEPDSVYIFSYAHPEDEGRSGLKFAWSPDGDKWLSVSDGFAANVTPVSSPGRFTEKLGVRFKSFAITGRWTLVLPVAAYPQRKSMGYFPFFRLVEVGSSTICQCGEACRAPTGHCPADCP